MKPEVRHPFRLVSAWCDKWSAFTELNFMKQSIESDARTEMITQNFKSDLRKAWKLLWADSRPVPKIKIEPVPTQAHAKLSKRETEEKDLK